MGISFLWLILVLILFTAFFWLSYRKDKFAEPYSIKFIGAIVIFFFFACLFSNNIVFPIEVMAKEGEVEIVFTGHRKTVEGKNRILNNLSSGSLLGYIPKKVIKKKTNLQMDYTDKEKDFLTDNGLLPVHNKNKKEPVFNKVIMIVLESFAYEYIHAVNPDIPAEASPCFDYLLNNYPHLNNLFTSDFPTLQGFNAILSSKIPFNEDNNNKQDYNFVSIFNNSGDKETLYINGVSKAYGNEKFIFEKIFGFNTLVFYEDLMPNYPEPKGYVWGYEDIVIYSEVCQILKKIKNDQFFMAIKLINGHQPISYKIVNNKNQPVVIKSHSSEIIKGIYDADNLLKSFIDYCESNKLIDDKTLVIITSDHYPPLGYGHTDLIKSDYHFQLGKLPLIFYSKNKEVFKNLNQDLLCCQLDIAPTLCELLGLDIPKEYMGQSLLSENFKPRSIGILNNETVFFQSEKLNFSENLINPATETVVIRKWINNLTAEL